MSLASALNISLGILRSFGNGFLNTQSLAGCSWTPSRLLHPVLQAKPVKIVEPPSEQLDSALGESGFCPRRGWILPSEGAGCCAGACSTGDTGQWLKHTAGTGVVSGQCFCLQIEPEYFQFLWCFGAEGFQQCKKGLFQTQFPPALRCCSECYHG